jgi:hypothetical protein
MLSRKFTVVFVFAMLAGLLLMDHVQSQSLNPFKAPAVLALGSGQAGAGAHCAALPTAD